MVLGCGFMRVFLPALHEVFRGRPGGGGLLLSFHLGSLKNTQLHVIT